MQDALINMVSHVTLGELGWRQKVYTSAICYFISRGSNNLLACENECKKLFNSHFNKTIFDECFDKSLRDNVVISAPDDVLSISKDCQINIDNNEFNSKVFEEESKVIFENIVKELNVEISWEIFKENYLRCVIQKLLHKNRIDSSFIAKISLQLNLDAEALSIAINRFMDASQSASVKSFLTGYLHGQYNISSIALTEKEIESWSPRTGQQYNIKLLVDTNYIFSILNLRDHPANEVVESIQKISSIVNNSIRFKYYILPRTIKELENSIKNEYAQMKSLCISPSMAHAIVKSGVANGFVLKFAKKFIESNYTINVQEHFRPYLENIRIILKGKGVELYNINENDITESKEYQDDLSNRLKFNARYEVGKQRNIVSIEHDLLLWHVVNARRPFQVASNIDAEFWVLTLDYRLNSFDRQKGGIPEICLTPLRLLEWLQIWLPQSEISSEAILTLLKLPTVDSNIEQDVQKASSKILNSLSSMGDTSGFSEETITELLLDKKLRHRINNAADESIDQLIENQFVEKIESLKSKVEEIKAKLGAEIDTSSEHAKELVCELNNVKAALQDKSENIELIKRNSDNSITELKNTLIGVSKERDAALKNEDQAKSEKINADKELRIRDEWEDYWVDFIKVRKWLYIVLSIIGLMIFGIYKTRSIWDLSEFFKLDFRLVITIPSAIIGVFGLSKLINIERIKQSALLIFAESSIKAREKEKFLKMKRGA